MNNNEQKKIENKIIEWIKKHKLELITAGTVVIAGTVLIIKNRSIIQINKAIQQNAIVSDFGILADVSKDICVKERKAPQIDFSVRRHVRNLPNGQHASKHKNETAAMYGFILNDRQTWVDSYKKYSKVKNIG